MATDEGYDSFLLDSSSLAIVRSTGRVGRNGDGDSRSYATTQLATDVGSTVVSRKNARLKSITFFSPGRFYRRDQPVDGKGGVLSEGRDRDGDDHENNDDSNQHQDDDLTFEVNDLTNWDIVLKDPISPQRKSGIFSKVNKVGDSLNKSKRPRLIVEDFEGLVEFSSFEAGDRLVSINKNKIKPEEFSAEEAMMYMRTCLEKDGILHVTTENPQGKDTIIHVTVIKPRTDMTYDDLGLVVWNWPFLCVKEIKEGSIFQYTDVKENDQISAINDIDCTRMREKAFARCASTLPTEITVTLIRRKHRYTGSFN